MNYKITKSEPKGETLETTIEFLYKDIIRTATIPHFHPTKDEVFVGISNRIASDIKAIDAAEVVNTIDLPIGEEQIANYIPVVTDEENPLSGYSVEELKQQITILSNEYNSIMEQRNMLDNNLAENSSKYDLLIDELAKRV